MMECACLSPAGPVRDNEHFIVWMRTAALPAFRKLWGRIQTDIPAGTTIRVDINNRYNSYRFGGKKKVMKSVPPCQKWTLTDRVR